MGITIFGDGTDIVHWEPNPTRRGTFDILATCMVTILLCVWSAVHLNIPRPGEYWKQVGRKIVWMLFALVAPELVAYMAWDQRQDAKRIIKKYNKTFGLPNPPSFRARVWGKFQRGFRKGGKLTRTSTVALENLAEPAVSAKETRHPWTMTHGFYMVMGGLVLDIPALPPEKNFLPDPMPEFWTFKEMGLNLLLESENGRKTIPDMSEVDIQAMSRASIFSKSLVCIQAGWFCVQCVARLAQGLPISLLELNTFGHSMCALVIYLLWWEKPFDVEKGTNLPLEPTLGIRAMHFMSRNATEPARQMWNGFLEWHGSPRLGSNLQPRSQKRYSELSIIQSSEIHEPESLDSIPDDLRPRDDSNELLASVTLKPGEKLLDTGFLVWPSDRQPQPLAESSPFTSFGDSAKNFRNHVDVTLDAVAVVRWRLAWQVMTEVKAITPRRMLYSLDPRASNWSNLAILDNDRESRIVALALITCSMVYGGLHALAWNANFATGAERTLWRIASVSVTGGALAIIVTVYLLLVPNLKSRIYLEGPPAILTVILIPFYFLARTYLVVECFINLAHMPAAVYQVPAWSTYFPHVS